MVYESLLLFGAVGLAAQTLGMAHGGHFSSSRAMGHGFHAQTGGAVAHGPAGQPIHAHGHVHANAHGHLHVHLNTASVARELGTLLLGLLSPLAIFSICLGAGAAGLAAQKLHERPGATIVIAVVGGFLLYGVVVRPLMGLLLKFESKPAETLEGAVAAEAVATGKFDDCGRGVVRVAVDGQLVRLLAHLETDDRDKAAGIAAGDKLLIVSVDKKRNACTVTPLEIKA